MSMQIVKELYVVENNEFSFGIRVQKAGEIGAYFP